MWIRKLHVRAFAGIEEAELEFGPGLNVLYGPNEVGKSSLVQAIRCALLLPDGSSAREPVVDWHADEPPQVTLEFETEPERIWRVRKSFGDGSEGFSYLESSRDGVHFSAEAKGREVDGRLQELLRWGVESPGGKGRRKRGIPESFLTTALLGDQARVEEILARGLGDDPDETGKERLTEALQALAEDPLFRRILESTQGHVDEAFTPTGRKKGGKASPWAQVRDELTAAEARRREIREKREESESTRVRIERLQRVLVAAREEDSEAAQALADANQAWSREQARREAAEALQAAGREVERIEGLVAAATKAQEELAAAVESKDGTASALAAAEAALRTARAAFESDREKVRELEGGDSEQRRRLREQEIEKKLLRLASDEEALRKQITRAEAVRSQVEKAEGQKQELERIKAQTSEARELLGQAQGVFDREHEELDRATLRQLALEVVGASREIRALDEAGASAEGHRAEAQRLQQEADGIRTEAAAIRVPEAAELRELDELQTDLRVAQEKLEVGLSAVVHALDALDAEVSSDGSPANTKRIAADESVVVEGKGAIAITVPGVLSVDVRGGSRALREEAEAAARLWQERTRSIFSEAEVEGLADLEALARRKAEMLGRVTELDAQVNQALARAGPAGGRAEEREALDSKAARARARLDAAISGDLDADELIVEMEVEDAPSLDEIRDDIDRRTESLEEKKELASQVSKEVARLEGILESRTEELEASQRELETAQQGMTHEPDVVLEQARGSLSQLEGDRADLQRGLESIRGEATAEIDGARRELQAAEEEVAVRQGAVEECRRSNESTTQTVTRLQTQVEMREAGANQEDLAAARQRVVDAQEALDREATDEREVSQEHREAAEERASRAKSARQNAELEVRQAEGALEQVGGQYVEEQLEQAEEAIVALTDRQHELELDYGAWRLLLETLKEAEAEDAIHLGSALVEPISARMRALTEGRYGDVEIGPELEATGIELAGEKRELERLSVGTKEQLATLVRLSVAEALTTGLVLDDQLTQTDPERMQHFRDLLRTFAEAFQIIVFTCRPEDYLSERELGASNFAEGRIRAQELRTGLRRSLASGSRTSRPVGAPQAVSQPRARPENGSAPGQREPENRRSVRDATATPAPEEPKPERQAKRTDAGRPAIRDLMSSLKNSLRKDDPDAE